MEVYEHACILLTSQLPYLLPIALSPIHIISLDLEQNCNSFFFFISFYASVNVTQNVQTDLSLHSHGVLKRAFLLLSLTIRQFAVAFLCFSLISVIFLWIFLKVGKVFFCLLTSTSEKKPCGWELFIATGKTTTTNDFKFHFSRCYLKN